MPQLVQSSYSEPQSDAGKPIDKPTRLGQVYTPKDVALMMAEELAALIDLRGALIVDPCIGLGALPKALLQTSGDSFSLQSYDIDPETAAQADKWIVEHLPNSPSSTKGDFLDIFDDTFGKWDAAIANPPYIRQEWIDKKWQYISTAEKKYGETIPGAANLYTHFIVKMVQGLREGGAFVALVYDSWTSTNYGRWLIDYLNRHATDIKSIPVRGTPFDGHLIDATILVGRRQLSTEAPRSIFSLDKNSYFEDINGFKPLEKEYWTKRGLRLKQASFFMGNETDIKLNGATRFAKKPSKLTGLMVKKNHPESALLIPQKGQGKPKIINELQERLKVARNNPNRNKSILNWVENRPQYWERHPEPPTAPILFNYYFRHYPKHIYNPFLYAYADNYYGIKPDNGLPYAAAFALLNSTAFVVELQNRSRRQGNGLRKLQLFEYRAALVPSIALFSARQIARLKKLGTVLAAEAKREGKVIAIDKVIYEASGNNKKLKPSELHNMATSFWRD